MVIVLGDILADYAIRVERLEIHPKDLQRVSYLGLGPGGACNVAIMSSHLGLTVCAMGEVGADLFGEIVLEGLARKGWTCRGSSSRPRRGRRSPTCWSTSKGSRPISAFPAA